MGYDKGKIYRLTCGDYFYYGSTITSLLRRATTHRYRAKTKSNKLYDYIRDKEWTIILIKDFPCKTKEELVAEESSYIKKELTNHYCLNERCSVWDIEKDTARKKEWYEKNKERILAKQKAKYRNKTSALK